MFTATLLGKIVNDPEFKDVKGTSLLKFRVMVPGAGEKDAETDRWGGGFLDVNAWGGQAETIANHFTKGKWILLSGNMRFEQWNSQDGKMNTRWSLRVEKFHFPLNDMPSAESAEAPARPRVAAAAAPARLKAGAAAASASRENDVEEEEDPFEDE
jgi:single-stranded DNA-binding protein